MVIEYSHKLGSSTRLYYVLEPHANRLGKTLVLRLMIGMLQRWQDRTTCHCLAPQTRA